MFKQFYSLWRSCTITTTYFSNRKRCWLPRCEFRAFVTIRSYPVGFAIWRSIIFLHPPNMMISSSGAIDSIYWVAVQWTHFGHKVYWNKLKWIHVHGKSIPPLHYNLSLIKYRYQYWLATTFPEYRYYSHLNMNWYSTVFQLLRETDIFLHSNRR